ncbi:STAS domain-containing protein [Lederbergia graminis]|uniref:Anti-sigma factor antagonist n=1 Tax=Lederbergia graminis TaxID=735518 RepID=A0ABW0LLV3_9BACI
MFGFSLNVDEDPIKVIFNGDLDIDSTEVVEEDLLPNIKSYQKVMLDFTEVLFVDSSGMGLLIHLVQTLQEEGVNVTIANVREEVMDVFNLLQLPDILGDDVFI